MNYQQIVSALNTLSASELSSLNVEIIEHIKFRRSRDAKQVKSTIKFGSVVRVNHPKAAGKQFTVNEIKRTKAVVVDNATNVRISVPLSLVEVIYA